MATQDRLASRLGLQAEYDAIEERARSGAIAHALAHTMLHELQEEMEAVRAQGAEDLSVDPEELLRKVPFFQGLPLVEFARVADRLKRRTAPIGDAIVRQDDRAIVSVPDCARSRSGDAD